MAVEALPAELARDLPDVPGVRHRLVDVHGVRLHVAEAGEGNPIVLQHGWPQHWYTWRHVIPELARTRRVVVPDLRGMGWSEAPPGRYEKETFAADLIALLGALGLEQVDLVAHDWGGFAGFLACLHAPDRFRRFLALGINHPWPQADPARFLRLLPRIGYQFVLATPFLGEVVLMASTAPVRRGLAQASARPIEPEAARSYATRLQGRARASATSALYRTFLLRELPALAQGRYASRRLSVPTRLLVGSEDPVISADNLEGYESHADDMTVTELRGVGHFIPDEAPEQVLEHIRSLMGEPVQASGNGATAPAEESVEEPWEGYDGMRVPEIRERLRDAPPELHAAVRLYEATHKNRTGVMRAVSDA